MGENAHKKMLTNLGEPGMKKKVPAEPPATTARYLHIPVSVAEHRVLRPVARSALVILQRKADVRSATPRLDGSAAEEVYVPFTPPLLLTCGFTLAFESQPGQPE